MQFLENIDQPREKYELPRLPFTLDEGLPPTLSALQIDTHYNKHHASYVNKLNLLIPKSEFSGTPLSHIIRESSKQLKVIKQAQTPTPYLKIFENAAQHFNHSFFWQCLKPNKLEDLRGADPLINQIKKDFGSFDLFKQEFARNANELFGSGWTWLIWDKSKSKLVIWNGRNAGTPWMDELDPVLCMDIWEHAYYIDYQSRRSDYINDMWQIINWKFCSDVFETVK